MALSVNGILFDELTGDPGTPAEGQMWYNTTAKQFKIYRNGAIDVLIDKATFDGHATSTSNPHTTTLEQARTAGATLSGDINMNNNTLTSIKNPSNDGDAANKGWTNEQIRARLRGLDWQDSVLDKDLATPPGSPSIGNRYIVAVGGLLAWLGKDKQIAEWDGVSAWIFTVPNEGFTAEVEDENIFYTYDGSAWASFGSAVDHGALLGRGDDDHTQYQLRTEKNAISGYCGLEADTTIGDTRHGSRGGGSLHSLVSSSGHGFYPQSNRAATTDPTINEDSGDGYVIGSRWLNTTTKAEWLCFDNTLGAAVWKETTNVASVLAQKSGHVLAASFATNPKKATVAFGAAFADANYSCQLTCVTQNNKAFTPSIESQLAGSFVINMEVNNITDLLQVNWHCTKDGESA